jgi:Cft2 family RNA processing exonuclease
MSQRRLTSSDLQNQLFCFPYGLGHEDEGVCLLVGMGPYRILLDCGLPNIEPLITGKQPPAHFVFCSHAHQDHCQGLLSLHRAFPQIPIYASEITAQLLHLNWLENQDHITFCQELQFNHRVNLFKNLQAEIFPAGHLPGAAAIFLTYKTPKRVYKLFYTGDFSLSNFQLVEGLSVEELRGLAPDVLILEGTYGTVRHPHRRQQEKHLMEKIYQAIASGKRVILPVPPLGLGQELLKLLRSHHQFTGKDLDIWVDGIIADACDLYLNLISQFPLSVQNFAKHQPLFWDERICPRMRRIKEENITELKSNCIVVTDKIEKLSGYCLANPGDWLILIPEHWRDYLEHPILKNLQSSSTITVDNYLLAEHSDGRNTTQLIHNLRPQHVIFVHGSLNYLADLSSLEELQNRYQLHTPLAETLVELPVGEKFIQPIAPTPTQYEGELNEQGTSITITLPDSIMQDPRWSSFADTGLVEARWQGEELFLRGLSQRELLSQNNKARNLESIDCCSNCSYYRSQRCWNPLSPLYGFKVTPEGYCPVFEPLTESE